MSKVKKEATSSLLNKSILQLQKKDSFVVKFHQCCENYEVNKIPVTIRIFPTGTTYPTFQDDSLSVKRSKTSTTAIDPLKSHLIVITDTTQALLQILLRYYSLETGHFDALSECLKSYGSITTLRLEFCNLSQLESLETLLKKNCNVKDLSLNGNPGISKEISTLIKDTNLAVLSIASCQLEDDDLNLLSKVLRESNELIALNVASNNITDRGILYLAEALRENRSLICLNLADNYITDDGCIEFLKVLQKFPLKHEEIVFRRKRNMERLKKINCLVQVYKSMQVKSSKKNSLTSDTFSEKKLKKSKRSNTSITKETASNGSSKLEQNGSFYEKLALQEIGPDLHPFVIDSFGENGEIFCSGNFTLQNLNLSYNKLKGKCFEYIKQLYEYQQIMKHGTIQIKINGNAIPEEDVAYLTKMFAPLTTSKISLKSSRSLRTKSSLSASVKGSLRKNSKSFF